MGSTTNLPQLVSLPDFWTINPPLPETEACTVTGQAAGVACAVSLQQNTVVCLGGRDVFVFFLPFGVIYVKNLELQKEIQQLVWWVDCNILDILIDDIYITARNPRFWPMRISWDVTPSVFFFPWGIPVSGPVRFAWTTWIRASRTWGWQPFSHGIFGESYAEIPQEINWCVTHMFPSLRHLHVPRKAMESHFQMV